MPLSQKQSDSIDASDARSNIWEGSVRSGKTVGLNYKWIEILAQKECPPGAHRAMVGRTERTLAVNILDPLQSLVGPRNFHYSTGQHKAYLFGHPIQLYGASDLRAEGRIRGATFADVLGDEMTLWPKGFYKMLMTRLSVENAQFFGSTNPDNPMHELKAEFIDKEGIDLKSFKFKLEDNPFLPAKYVSDLKKEYSGLFYKRFILGEWCIAEGAIYDFFEEDLHTGNKMPTPRFYFVGVDYGTGNPTSFGLYGVNPASTPCIWRIKGYWWDSKKEGKQKTDGEYSADMKTFLGEIKPQAIIVDPSAASFKAQLRKDHNYFVKDADNDVLDGIRLQAKMLKTGQYMVSRHPSNKFCINEYYSYVWDPRAAQKGEDKPLKENDHCLSGDTLIDVGYDYPHPIAALVGTEGLVRCYDPITKKPIMRKYFNVRKTREQMAIWMVQTETGKTVFCTYDHKIMTPIGFVKAFDLRWQDRVICVTDNESHTEKIETVFDTGAVRDTYCMTVEEVHNFSVNGGLIVANSKDEERYVLFTEFKPGLLDYSILTRN